MPSYRVGHYLSAADMGGMQRHVLSLIDHLDPRECATLVFCEGSAWSGPFFDELARRGIAMSGARPSAAGRQERHGGDACGPTLTGPARGVWQRLPRSRLKALVRRTALELAAALRLRPALAAAKLDVIHLHGGPLDRFYPAVIASRLARIRTRILTVHMLPGPRADADRIIERLALGSVHHIVAPAHHVKRTLVELKGADPGRIRVIPHGVPAGGAEGGVEPVAARAALGCPADAPLAGMIGRLHRQKGADLLLRATAAIRERVPGASIVLIGEGPERDALQRLAEAEGVAEGVVFAGYRPDASRLIGALDVLVLPSREEVLSLSALEAMAGGKPVVATDVGGLPELVVHGRTGLLVPPEDVAALAESVARLLTDVAAARAMGRAGRERVEAHFSEAAMLERTFTLYGRSRRGSPPAWRPR